MQLIVKPVPKSGFGEAIFFEIRKLEVQNTAQHSLDSWLPLQKVDYQDTFHSKIIDLDITFRELAEHWLIQVFGMGFWIHLFHSM